MLLITTKYLSLAFQLTNIITHALSARGVTCIGQGMICKFKRYRKNEVCKSTDKLHFLCFILIDIVTVQNSSKKINYCNGFSKKYIDLLLNHNVSKTLQCTYAIFRIYIYVCIKITIGCRNGNLCNTNALRK